MIHDSRDAFSGLDDRQGFAEPGCACTSRLDDPDLQDVAQTDGIADQSGQGVTPIVQKNLTAT